MTDRWAALVYQAKEKCAGCRTPGRWGLYAVTGAERDHHLLESAPMKCEALDLRRQIRALTPAKD